MEDWWDRGALTQLAVSTVVCFNRFVMPKHIYTYVYVYIYIIALSSVISRDPVCANRNHQNIFTFNTVLVLEDEMF